MRQLIEIHINELNLHGFSGHDRYSIGSAVGNELVRLFREQGVPATLAQNVNIESLNAGTFLLKAGAKTVTVGTNVANSVYKGLKKR
jgi:hypothetical protein